jgi:hypothetical protein
VSACSRSGQKQVNGDLEGVEPDFVSVLSDPSLFTVSSSRTNRYVELNVSAGVGGHRFGSAFIRLL